ncbi:MAG: 5-formyltetrahydrofolate cyclo-ligase [Coriobacteriia bacterium]|nr:5-formyltetrahydrofolate cyclo-ligase [Coriobacteriia bacterium]
MAAENTPGSPAAEKRVLRAQARAVRDALSPEARASAADLVARALSALPELATARVVLVYAALPAELDLTPAIAAFRARGVTIAYPRVEPDGVLGIHAVARESELVSGPFGLVEPAADAPRVAPEDLDAVIVPAIAYDSCGLRLGYGGGYYDRLLPTLRPGCIRIGAVFDEQLLTEIPAEPHDQGVDLVVTPTRVIRTTR